MNPTIPLFKDAVGTGPAVPVISASSLPNPPSTSADSHGHAVFADSDSESLTSCCLRTIKIHAKFNEMMVCSECKQIIKCFVDDKALRNYLKFCETRHRKVITAVVEGYKIVAYSS